MISYDSHIKEKQKLVQSSLKSSGLGAIGNRNGKNSINDKMRLQHKSVSKAMK